MLLSNETKKGAGLVALLILLFPLTDAQSWFSALRRGHNDEQRVRGGGNPYSSLEEGLLSSPRVKEPASTVLRKLTKAKAGKKGLVATPMTEGGTVVQQGDPDEEYGAGDSVAAQGRGGKKVGGKKVGTGSDVRPASSGGKKVGGKKVGTGSDVRASSSGGKKVGGKKVGTDRVSPESGTPRCPGSKGGKKYGGEKGGGNIVPEGGSSGPKGGKKGAGLSSQGARGGGKKGNGADGVRTTGTYVGSKGGKKYPNRKPAVGEESDRNPRLEQGGNEECEEPDRGEDGGPDTAEPTVAPTAKPTVAPTASPTRAPTPELIDPVGEPDTLPPVFDDGKVVVTESPTSSPTFGPTNEPTSAPTQRPTSEPTSAPTQRPTVSPTSEPTSAPTQRPTASPTSKPTAAPTQRPTASPTSKPTAAPTQRPTANPTSEPTTSPTASPTSEPTATPTTSPTDVPTYIKETLPPVDSDNKSVRTPSPTASPTSSPTAEPTVAPTSGPTNTPTITPTAEPTPAPNPRPVEEGGVIDAPVCEPAYVYCEEESVCFLDSENFNGGQTASAVGWSIDYGDSLASLEHGCECDILILSTNPPDCNLERAIKIGTALISDNGVGFVLYGSSGYKAESIQMYAGPCVGSDAGNHVSSDDGVSENSGTCDATQVATYAADTSKYPLQWKGTELVTGKLFYSGTPVNTTYWGDSYYVFPLGEPDRRYISAQLTVCPTEDLKPSDPAPTALPTVAPSRSPTKAPSKAPVPVPTDPVGGEEPDSPAPTATPTAAPTSAPTSGPTGKPTAAPTSAPTSGPTSKPTSAPTSSPTSAPTSAPTSKPTAAPTSGPTTSPSPAPSGAPSALVEESGPEVCQPAVLHCPDQSICLVDPNFNGGQMTSSPGWSIDLGNTVAPYEHECICEIILQPAELLECVESKESVIGTATVSESTILFFLEAPGYMESIQVYAGPCVGSDAGGHLDRADNVTDIADACDATEVATYADDFTQYPLQWEGNETAMMFDGSSPVLGSDWGSNYSIFPLGDSIRQFMSAHLNVCLEDGLPVGPRTSAPTSSPTSKPTAAPTSAPTSSPTSAPTSAPTTSPTSTPTAAPSAAPSVVIEEGGGPEDCQPAYVYCPGQSVCFLDSINFNGGQTASGPGWSVDFGVPKNLTGHDCECQILIQSARDGDECSTDSALAIGVAVVSKNGIAFVLHGSGYKAESIQVYSGPCEGSDAGGHLDRADGSCNATEVATYAADTSKYPLQWEGTELETSMLFHAGTPINTTYWGEEYYVFPLGEEARRYMSAQLTVCPEDGAIVPPPMTPNPTALPTVAPYKSPTKAPSKAPVPILVDPVGGEEPVSPAPTDNPTATPTAEPSSQPTPTPATKMPVVEAPGGSVPCIQDSDCDDGIECTQDTCYSSTYCVFTPIDLWCDDGIECTVERCDAGDGCVNTPDNSECDDSIDCTTDICDAASGCIYITDDSQCDDGIACTTDTCDASSGCVYTPNNSECDDGVDCTVDTCDAKSGCVYTPDNSACDDGVDCTTDTCFASSGCVSTPNDSVCDDGIECTTDTCNASTGCVSTPNNSACDDGIDCTTDTCDAISGCVSTPNNSECDDGVPCTVDTCEVSSGCVYTPENSLCSDGIPCTVDACDASIGCVFTPEDSLCSDSDVCTFDRCDVTSGCVYSEFNLPFPKPGGSVKVTADYPGTVFGDASYFDLEIDSFLNEVRTFDSYCIDEDTSISPKTQYCGNMYSSHPNDWEDLPDTVVFEKGVQTFSLVNWIINQDYPNKKCGRRNRNYTYGDIQRAIWEIIEGDGNVRSSGLGTWSQVCTDEIQAAAVANGQGFIPQCDELVIMIIFPFECTDPDVMKQTLLAIVPLSEVHPCCTV